MKKLLLALLLPLTAQAQFHECRMAGVAESMTYQRPALSTWINASTPVPATPMNGSWETVDVGDIVPPYAKCARVTGVLMISNGGASQYGCDIHIGFRKHGSAIRASRGAQTVATPGTGARTNFSRWVPLTAVGNENRFDLRIEAYNYGTFPTYTLNPQYAQTCSMGVTAWIDAWGE